MPFSGGRAVQNRACRLCGGAEGRLAMDEKTIEMITKLALEAMQKQQAEKKRERAA